MRHTVSRLTCLLILICGLPAACAVADEIPVERWAKTIELPAEPPEDAAARHERVRARRAQTAVISHRGSWEFAHENTLEAFRATFELGGDGNEIDIRATKDGVLICFHDDMLDSLLHAYGDTPDYPWDELQTFRFRETGPFGDYCRIPTLVEVFELHRRQGGLLQLDFKRPGLDRAIATLLDRMDLWDHVVASPGEHIRQDQRFAPLSYMASLYLDRGDMFPDAIAAALAKPGHMVMVEDPRAIALALGRTWQRPSEMPVTPAIKAKSSGPTIDLPPQLDELLATLGDADDWDRAETDEEVQAHRAARILKRAQAADVVSELGRRDPEILALLEERVRRRSLHHDWRSHGLDGAAALRALFALESDQAVPLARFILFRDDPELARVQNPMYDSPRAWTDFRQKMLVFHCLERHPLAGTAELCRDYLKLSEDEARRIGVPQFEHAARTLLTTNPNLATAVELLRHPRQEVRGRAILICLRHGDEAWAEAALREAAPHALAYRLPNR